MSSFAKGVKQELKKVIWPNRSELVNNTAVVVAMVAIIGAFIFVADMLLGWGITGLITRVAQGTVHLH
jgi:preprotein translocase subunit SecE